MMIIVTGRDPGRYFFTRVFTDEETVDEEKLLDSCEIHRPRTNGTFLTVWKLEKGKKNIFGSLIGEYNAPYYGSFPEVREYCQNLANR